ncbi:hypothetical protein BHE74_00056076 [Ensete ventricosum]|nr:hypothetical protein BHE74_00056076 [Ensete ventricosum]RZS26927.1 hypothetical protein BHM03_00060342 [Ensete ventricosum]
MPRKGLQWLRGQQRRWVMVVLLFGSSEGVAAGGTVSNGGATESNRRLQRRWLHGLQATTGDEAAMIDVGSCNGDRQCWQAKGCAWLRAKVVSIIAVIAIVVVLLVSLLKVVSYCGMAMAMAVGLCEDGYKI